MSPAEQRKRVLLQRYLSGAADFQEEQELRHLAKADPFLAEAISGYEQQPKQDHQAALSRIRQRIPTEKKQRRMVPIYWQRAIAAAILLLLGSAAIWYLNEPASPIAQSEATKQDLAEAPPQLAEEELAVVSEKKVEQPVAPGIDESPTPKPTPPSPKTVPKPTPAPPKATPATVPTTTAPTVATDEVAIIEPEQLATVTTEKADYSQLTSAIEDSAYSQVIPQLQALTTVEEAIEEQHVEETTKMEEQPASRAARALDIEPPKPVIGSVAYKEYIGQNIDRTITFMRKLKGPVQLEFTISNNGTPTDFKVLQSLCEACDKEAIRIVEQGPKWAPKGRRATYTIRF